MIALRYHYQHCVPLLPLLFFLLLLLLLAWKVLLKKVFLEAPTIITTFFICRVFLSYENNYIVGTFIEVGHKMIFNKDYIFIVIQAYNIKCKSKYFPSIGKIYFVQFSILKKFKSFQGGTFSNCPTISCYGKASCWNSIFGS